jgi:MFS superfamily sulfate permease-like transporter
VISTAGDGRIFFALMLSSVDIIEQVMSNAAIEKIDPLGRKANSNNSLLAIWIANLASCTFQGMTNLDSLAKSSTNRMAGAVTKMSALFVAGVLAATLAYPEMLQHLPKFSLAVLMIFTGWKMSSTTGASTSSTCRSTTSRSTRPSCGRWSRSWPPTT